MKRNSSIELVKLFFAISIALGHFSADIIPGGIVVTLFFVMSGYFLVGSFDSKKYSDAWDYSMGRVKRMYPYYLFAFVVLAVHLCLRTGQNAFGIITCFITSLPELFMMQNIGVFDGGMNYPLWQLCTLIVVSHIMFGLLQWNKNATINVICPTIAIITFTYLGNVSASPESDIWGVKYSFIYIPLLRAAGSLSIGMFLNYPIKKTLHCLENSNLSFLPVLVSAATAVTVAVFWVNRNSYASVFPFVFLLICAFYSKGVLSKIFQLPCFGKLDKLSLAIYLNHALIIYLFEANSQLFLKISPIWINIIYLTVLIIYSVVMLVAVDLLVVCMKRIAIHMTNKNCQQNG